MESEEFNIDPTDLTKNPTSINMKKNMDSNKSVHFARRKKNFGGHRDIPGRECDR